MEPGPPPAPPLTIDQAAALARVSRRTVYTWLRSGKLPYVRTPGGAVRITPADLFRRDGPRTP